MQQGSVPATHSGVTVRRACPADVADIYALKVAAFGQTSLPFTIYRSPLSVKYLEELVSGADPGVSIMVALASGKFAGYFQAIAAADTSFLSYIAVGENHRGKGIGAALLEAFEGQGAEAGRHRFSLEMIAADEGLRQWYEKFGYQVVSQSTHSAFRLGGFPADPAPPLTWEPREMERALANERERGFTKTHCMCGDNPITVGLIGGDICKLLDRGGLDLGVAMASVARAFQCSRQHLVYSGSGQLPPHWIAERRLPVLRMEKERSA